MKYLTKAWKAMSEEEKAKYKDYSEKDRSRFDYERKELKSAPKDQGEPAVSPPEVSEFKPDSSLLGKRSRESMKQVNYAPLNKNKKKQKIIINE